MAGKAPKNSLLATGMNEFWAPRCP